MVDKTRRPTVIRGQVETARVVTVVQRDTGPTTTPPTAPVAANSLQTTAAAPIVHPAAPPPVMVTPPSPAPTRAPIATSSSVPVRMQPTTSPSLFSPTGVPTLAKGPSAKTSPQSPPVGSPARAPAPSVFTHESPSVPASPRQRIATHSAEPVHVGLPAQPKPASTSSQPSGQEARAGGIPIAGKVETARVIRVPKAASLDSRVPRPTKAVATEQPGLPTSGVVVHGKLETARVILPSAGLPPGFSLQATNISPLAIRHAFSPATVSSDQSATGVPTARTVVRNIAGLLQAAPHKGPILTSPPLRQSSTPPPAAGMPTTRFASSARTPISHRSMDLPLASAVPQLPIVTNHLPPSAPLRPSSAPIRGRGEENLAIAATNIRSMTPLSGMGALPRATVPSVPPESMPVPLGRSVAIPSGGLAPSYGNPKAANMVGSALASCCGGTCDCGPKAEMPTVAQNQTENDFSMAAEILDPSEAELQAFIERVTRLFGRQVDVRVISDGRVSRIGVWPTSSTTPQDAAARDAAVREVKLRESDRFGIFVSWETWKILGASDLDLSEEVSEIPSTTPTVRLPSSPYARRILPRAPVTGTHIRTNTGCGTCLDLEAMLPTSSVTRVSPLDTPFVSYGLPVGKSDVTE